jgi:hypothetical protein
MSLTGVWMNELNSAMVLNEHEDRSLTGKYRSMVGRDNNLRELSGRTSAVDGGKQMAAFAVCFEIASPDPGYGRHSVCAWSGWFRNDDTGNEIIDTQWLLSINVLDKEGEWASTKIGKSTFRKVSGTADETLLTNDETLNKLHKSFA